MSGTKETKYALLAAASRVLDAQKRESERLREQQRRMEEERERHRLLENNRAQRLDEAEQLKAQITVARSFIAKFAGDALQRLEQELEDATHAIRAVGELSGFGRISRDIRGLGKRLDDLNNEAKAVQLSDQAHEAVELLREQLGQLDRGLWSRFAPGAAETLEDELRSVEKALSRHQSVEVRQKARAAMNTLAQQKSSVTQAYDQWLEQKSGAETRCAEVRVRLAGLRGDTMILKSCGPGLAALERHANAMEQQIGLGNLDAIQPLAHQIQVGANDLVREAEKMEESFQKNQFVAEKIAAALRTCGGVIQKESTASDRAMNQTNGIRILVRFPTKNAAAAVSIASDGSMTWDGQGFRHEQKIAGDGSLLKSCESELALINEIRSATETNGVQIPEPTWRGKPPKPCSGAKAKAAHIGSKRSERGA